MKPMVNLDITVMQSRTANELCRLIKKMLLIIDTKKRKSEAVRMVIQEANFALRISVESRSENKRWK